MRAVFVYGKGAPLLQGEAVGSGGISPVVILASLCSLAGDPAVHELQEACVAPAMLGAWPVGTVDKSLGSELSPESVEDCSVMARLLDRGLCCTPLI